MRLYQSLRYVSKIEKQECLKMSYDSGKGWSVNDGVLKTDKFSLSMSEISGLKYGYIPWAAIPAIVCFFAAIAGTIHDLSQDSWTTEYILTTFLGFIVAVFIVNFLISAERIKFYSGNRKFIIYAFSKAEIQDLRRLRNLAEHEMKSI
ncbi:MAG: hypothetical protein D3916_15665 [Candidatus Electrothrix sp. MAN1_4]|nr:hypothetical protein [Candidatus Electrothrix sp. MAN1_4]